jgi:hypothetical protein
MRKRKTVYVCEDHPLYRQSLEELVNGKEGLDLLGSCGDGATALETFAEFVLNNALLFYSHYGRTASNSGFRLPSVLSESKMAVRAWFHLKEKPSRRMALIAIQIISGLERYTG